MSTKTIILMALLMIALILLLYIFDPVVVMLISSVLLLSEAILFSVKKELYYKFLKELNPKGYQVMKDRGEEFLGKMCKKNIITLFIVGGFTFIISIAQLLLRRIGAGNSYQFEMSGEYLILFVTTALIFTAAAYLIDRYFLKKIRQGMSLKELLTKEILIGILLTLFLFAMLAAAMGVWFVSR